MGTPFRTPDRVPAISCSGFDNGHFSEFGTFSITDWIKTTPRHVLARNLNLPESAFGQMPQKELYIGPGRVPPAVEDIRNADLQPTQASHKFRLGKMAPHVFAGGEERIVTQNEFPIQTTLTAVRMDLKPGALREMHWHPHADEWQFYVKGRARVTIFGSHGRVKTEEFGPGTCGLHQTGLRPLHRAGGRRTDPDSDSVQQRAISGDFTD